MASQLSDNACNAQNAVAFAVTYKPHCLAVALKLNVPVEFILGIAAEESTRGSGHIARVYNNYFSIESKNPHFLAPFSTGVAMASGTVHKKQHVYVAKYKSFNDSAESFSSIYGNVVSGQTDATELAKALVAVSYNTGDSTTGGRNDFITYLVGIIGMTKQRMDCPQ
jgi:flagellum-specific peptidoglycan hydrolase FlgJ